MAIKITIGGNICSNNNGTISSIKAKLSAKNISTKHSNSYGKTNDRTNDTKLLVKAMSAILTIINNNNCFNNNGTFQNINALVVNVFSTKNTSTKQSNSNGETNDTT